MKAKHLRVIADLTPEDASEVLELAVALRADRKRGALSHEFDGKSVALIFHKPSLRTRVSFEAALNELGASGVYLTQAELGDTVDDVLRYVHFDSEELLKQYRRKIARVDLEEDVRNTYLEELEAGLRGYTYLED